MSYFINTLREIQVSIIYLFLHTHRSEINTYAWPVKMQWEVTEWEGWPLKAPGSGFEVLCLLQGYLGSARKENRRLSSHQSSSQWSKLFLNQQHPSNPAGLKVRTDWATAAPDIKNMWVEWEWRRIFLDTLMKHIPKASMVIIGFYTSELRALKSINCCQNNGWVKTRQRVRRNEKCHFLGGLMSWKRALWTVWCFWSEYCNVNRHFWQQKRAKCLLAMSKNI